MVISRDVRCRRESGLLECRRLAIGKAGEVVWKVARRLGLRRRAQERGQRTAGRFEQVIALPPAKKRARVRGGLTTIHRKPNVRVLSLKVYKHEPQSLLSLPRKPHRQPGTQARPGRISIDANKCFPCEPLVIQGPGLRSRILRFVLHGIY